nr:E3 ubiquitin-protein ligase RBBP6 isoform X2 [Parasteatoda tepidariorum]
MASAWSQLDQLLTCAICLDRYRNPKLLPCQHTFCMEPCLDGLIDYARRQIKCPECRAEHRIPYQGIQQFPTNVTLMRFLELHRDITGEEPEPPPSMMERCNVCSEKSNVERCAHCEKKICPDCKEAHVDILRREINRINNQVRRGLHRLSDALSQTKKNAEKLQLNCKQVKEEIDDIVKRYSKDLKVTEGKLKHDLEVYTQTELKSITKLREDLEIEVNNISSNCELVDKYIKDDYEWSDVELLEYKQIFLKMLDFLRTYDSDSTDFARRIKFQPRADPDVLHKNIADFGELKINAPMNPVPTQQSLMPPNTNALMRSQSDHRLAAQFARRCDNRSFSDINQRMDSERERPTSPLLGRNRRDTDGYRRYSERSREYDYQDRSSSRYSREDTGLSSRWRDGSDDYSHRNRYNRDYEDSESEPHQSRTVRFADEQQQRERIFDVDDSAKGPLSGVVRLLDSPKVMERLHQNEVKQKLQQAESSNSEVVPSTPAVTTPIVPQPKRPTSRQQSEDDIDRQKKANQQADASSSSTPQTPQVDASSTAGSRRSSVSDSVRNTESIDSTSAPPESSEYSDSSRSKRRLSGTTSFDEPANDIRTFSRYTRSPLVKTTSLDAGEACRKPLDKKLLPRAATPLRQQDSEDSDEDDDDDDEAYQIATEPPPKPVQSSFFNRQRRLPEPEPRLLEMHDNDSDEESESDDDEEDEPAQITGTTAESRDNNATESEDDEDDEEEEEESSSSSESENESKDSEDQVFPKSNLTNAQSGKQSGSKSTETQQVNSKSQVSDSYESESDDQNDPTTKETDEEDDDEEEECNTKVPSSVSTITPHRIPVNCDSNTVSRVRKRSDDTDTTDSSTASSSTNYHSLNNTDTAVNTSNHPTEDRISSEGSSNDSTPSRFRRRPFLARSRSSHEIGLGIDSSLYVDDEEEDDSPTPYRSRSKRLSEDMTRTRPSDSETTASSNNCWAKYLNNKYGSNATGRVVPRSKSSHSLYQKSDSETSDDESPTGPMLSSSYAFSNPRSTYMQKRRMLMKIGSRGSDSSNFTWPRGVAVGPDNSIVVADSSNHRIQWRRGVRLPSGSISEPDRTIHRVGSLQLPRPAIRSDGPISPGIRLRRPDRWSLQLPLGYSYRQPGIHLCL